MPTALAEAPRRFLNPQDNCWHVQIAQGECHVTGDAREVLTTVLGSCIAACIRDPLLGIGGMNHFLLPRAGRAGDHGAARFGVNAMELLINGLIKLGGVRSRFEAKLFGGANVVAGLSDVGAGNVAFAEKFLADEGIALVGGDVRGAFPRRVQYWPSTGRALQRALPAEGGSTLVARELVEAVEAEEPGHDLELF
jgi:chemotaxis protein CheD